MKNQIETAFGVNAVDLTGIVGAQSNITEIEGSVYISGIGNVQGTFFEPTHFLTGISTFRPYIRGFLILCTMIFNVRMFQTTIGQSSVFGRAKKEGDE